MDAGGSRWQLYDKNTFWGLRARENGWRRVSMTKNGRERVPTIKRGCWHRKHAVCLEECGGVARSWL